jgi:hypothetical protein
VFRAAILRDFNVMCITARIISKAVLFCGMVMLNTKPHHQSLRGLFSRAGIHCQEKLADMAVERLLVFTFAQSQKFIKGRIAHAKS